MSSFLLQLRVSILLTLPIICSTNTNDINIIYFWFDDLGFGDTGYNGGDYPTPILDALATKDAIKVNFHYTEQVCSASRSSLLTGRYSWLSGLNSVSGLNTIAGYDTTLKLFPEILQNEGYTTFISGKWHIGYSHERDLPYNRGFENGVYSHQGLQYYDRGFVRGWSRFDNVFGEPSKPIKAERRCTFGNNYKVNIHDTYKIEKNATGNNYYDKPVLFGSTGYNEDLYTEAIKDYVKNLDGSKPFFIYYSLWTPHATITQPPVTRPDGTAANFTACYNAFPNKTTATCDLNNDTRCVFCKQVHYASQNIQEIIDEIKKNSKLDWNKTIVIVTSDNGATPTSRNGLAFGSALPYRGVKSGTHEGGIRTPAIIKGGYVENILKTNSGLTNNMCAYNNMFHISDWYHVFMSMLNIDSSHSLYSPDSDHSKLGVWNNILCHCKGQKDATTCDTSGPSRVPRDELIMMRMCGNPNATYSASGGGKFFYSAYVRKGDWKLVINGSNVITETCDNITHVVGGSMLSNYIHANDTKYKVPNETYYHVVYRPRIEYDNGSLSMLYKSECLEDLISSGSPNVNDINYGPYNYSSLLLYNITADRIEACSVNNSAIEQQLFNYLLNRSVEYNIKTGTVKPAPDFGSFRAQMDSFDCNATYTLPWNENSTGNVNNIWTSFIAKGKQCSNMLNNCTDSEASSSVVQVISIPLEQKPDRDIHSEYPPFGSYQWIYAYYWLVVVLVVIIFILLIIIARMRYSQSKIVYFGVNNMVDEIEMANNHKHIDSYQSDSTINEQDQDELL